MYQDIFFGSTQPPYARGEYNWDGRYTSLVNQIGQQHRTRAAPAQPDPVARAGRRRFPRRPERDPRLAVRRRRRVQDLSRRLRPGQLARLVEADGELRPALGLLQPRTGTRGGAGQHGARGRRRAVPDSGGVEETSRCRRASSATSRRTASSWCTPTSSAAASARCRRTTSRRASMPRISSAQKYVLRAGYGLFYGAFENRGGNPSLGYNYPFQFTLVYQSPNDTAPNRLAGRIARRPRRPRPDRARPGQRQRQRSDAARRRVRLPDAAVSQLQRDAADRSAAESLASRSATSARRGRHLETFTGMNNVHAAAAAGHQPAAVRAVARFRARVALRPHRRRELLRLAAGQVPAALPQRAAVPA